MHGNVGEKVSGVSYSVMTTDQAMAVYDLLPPVVRRAISEAPLQVSPLWALKHLQDGYPDELVAEIVHQRVQQIIDQAYRERGIH